MPDEPGARADTAETLGVLGGSFDPPHAGHVMMAALALTSRGMDRVLVVPAYRHPLGKRGADFRHRLAMARLAFAPLGPRVTVDDIEARLAAAGAPPDAPSYTIDTLHAIAREHPAAQLRLVIGSDILAQAHLWHRWDDITALAPPAVFTRAGDPCPGPAAGPAPAAAPAETTPGLLPEISSTALRATLAAGHDPGDQLPRAVVGYIRNHGLYRALDDTPAPH